MMLTSDQLRGYRSVWKILRDRYKIYVPRLVVKKALKEVDPEGVENRRRRRLKRRKYVSKGPNYIWHIDGYDKLSPFGLTIHGCIDGFSRKIIWLKMSSTNSDPKVILRYYLNVIVDEMNGRCPKILRVDKGTENVGLAGAHISLCLQHIDELTGEKSFIYGASKHNIRIEAWWSQLRKAKTDWWINILKDWEDKGVIDLCDQLHRRELFAFTVGGILQNELDEFVEYWNSHKIRKNKLTDGPQGIPNDMYDTPELFNATDHGVIVDQNMVHHCYIHESIPPPNLIDDEVYETANLILQSKIGIDRRDINTKKLSKFLVK